MKRHNTHFQWKRSNRIEVQSQKGDSCPSERPSWGAHQQSLLECIAVIKRAWCGVLRHIFLYTHWCVMVPLTSNPTIFSFYISLHISCHSLLICVSFDMLIIFVTCIPLWSFRIPLPLCNKTQIRRTQPTHCIHTRWETSWIISSSCLLSALHAQFWNATPIQKWVFNVYNL